MCCYDCERGYLLGVKLVTDVGNGSIKKKSMTIAARILLALEMCVLGTRKRRFFFFVVNERRDETRYPQMMREHPSSITISIALGWLAGLWLSGVD